MSVKDISVLGSGRHSVCAMLVVGIMRNISLNLFHNEMSFKNISIFISPLCSAWRNRLCTF